MRTAIWADHDDCDRNDGNCEVCGKFGMRAVSQRVDEESRAYLTRRYINSQFRRMVSKGLVVSLFDP